MAMATSDLFINLIQNNPIIFDKKSKDFKNIKKKEETWILIANQSRMTVDAAKKRYFSLRQKYSREKRNIELKRRNKQVVRKNWVFYDRLQFLDAFIQPRSTFTNDTFHEEDHEDMRDEEDIADLGEENVDGPHAIIEINDILLSDTNTCTINSQTIIDQNEDLFILDSEIQSSYSGKVSRTYLTSNTLQDSAQEVESSQIKTNSTTDTTGDQPHENDPFDPFDLDNFMSPRSSTNSCHLSPSHNSTFGEAASIYNQNLTTATGIRPQYSIQSSTQQPPPQDVITVPHNTNNPRLNRTAGPSLTSIRTGLTSTSQKILPQRVSALTSSSRDKALESIRNKMDSCLNAIHRKVADKCGQSPHAPFLAYLGTKLPAVPREMIGEVETKILELVKSFSK